MPLEKTRQEARAGLRRVHVHTRILVGLAACVVCLILSFVCIFAPLFVLRNRDAEYATQMRKKEYTAATDAILHLHDALARSMAITRLMEGYVTSRMATLPNLSGTVEERLEGQYFPDFDRISELALRNSTGIARVLLAPGGVYQYAYPRDPSITGLDLMDPTNEAHAYDPTPLDTIAGRHFDAVGPFRSTTNLTGRNGEWRISLRRPIYQATTYEDAGMHNFWGFASVSVNLSYFLFHRITPAEAFGPSSTATGPASMHYLCTARTPRSNQTTILTSTIPHLTAQDAEAFVRQGTTVQLSSRVPFTITVRGRHYGRHLSAHNITVVVSTVMFGVLLVLAAVLAMLLWCQREYDAARYAPKMAPFAMLTIGPCRGEQLWDSAPEEVAKVTEQLGQRLTQLMVYHHAYPIQQVHPLTTSCVTRSVAAAVQMAFDAIEQLQRHPIDAPLRAALGDADGRLLLSFAVHWCTDAAVRVESLQGSYRYEGPDVVFGGRMWAFAAPGVVTASAAVVAALPRFGLRCVAARPHRVVHVVRSRTRCGATDATGTTADTIYVPPPAPTAVQATAVQATAGVWERRCSATVPLPLDDSAGGGGGDTDDAQPLPAQPLFTLMDARRPALLAAEAAAPRNVNGFPAAAAGSPVSFAAALATSAEVLAPVAMGAVEVDGVLTMSPSRGTIGLGRAPSISSLTSTVDHLSLEAEEEEDAAATHASSALDRPLMRWWTLGAPVAASGGSGSGRRRSGGSFQGDAVTRALLQPIIPRSLDVALHTAFDYQAITLNMHYMDVRVLVYYFHASYKILFRPLAAPERHNIFRRLVTAFGVPQQGILEHLAARCVLRSLQRNARARQAAALKRRRERADSEAPVPLKTRVTALKPRNDAAL